MDNRRWLILLLPFLLLLQVYPVEAAPAITITPASGPQGSRFIATLSGFAPGERVALRLTALGSTPRSLDVPAVLIEADGRYLLTIETLALPAGGYTLEALRAGVVVASAGFTITPTPTPTRRPASPTTRPPLPTATRLVPTAPATGSGGVLPGLPNTGNGPGGPGIATPLLLTLALVTTLVAVVGGRVRRRITWSLRFAGRHTPQRDEPTERSQ